MTVSHLIATRRALVTGGAGFIGSSLVAGLLERGYRVTVFDNLSGADDDWWTVCTPFLHRGDVGDGPLAFVKGDVRDLASVTDAMRGHDLVAHLAAHTDIAGGAADPRRDLETGVLGTWNVLEAMRRTGARELLYASSGTVYGNPARRPTPEDYGPLLPESNYAAAKLAGEALISGFAALYGWRTLSFRFGNTVGARSNHGVVFDLAVKLMRDGSMLEILGDGRQAKPYVAVEDVVAGILLAHDRAPRQSVSAFNIGSAQPLTVARVADLVIEGLGLSSAAVQRRYLGAADGGGGWPGDTKLVDFDCSALRRLGWSPQRSAQDAIRLAAAGTRDRLLQRGGPLLTAGERRRSQAASDQLPRQQAAAPQVPIR